MDNLRFMKQLADNSIDLIYADILYNTHRRFSDFSDDLGTTASAIEWYRPRLMEMYRILKKTGQVYLQMDHRLVHYLKVLMDELFGEFNFRNEIIWVYNSSPRKKNAFSHRHDTILRYSKTREVYFDDTKVREPYALSAPRGYEKERYYHPLGKVMGDVWQINMLAQNDKTERIGYSTQKPKSLLTPIIASSCPPNGIVLDVFCGSGTALVVAKELGYHFLGCDISARAIELAKQRLAKVNIVKH